MADEATERLVILLQARDAGFEREVKKMRTLLERESRKASNASFNMRQRLERDLAHSGRSFTAWGKAGVVSIALIAAQLTGGAMRNAIKSMADLADQADLIGIDVEAYQGLERGFGLAGVEASELNSSLQIFSQRLGEASEGQGDLYKHLRNNGIALRDQHNQIRPLQDVLGDYADLIARTSSESEQLALATDAFGRAGRPMVLALREGRAGLDAMQESMRAAGLGLDAEFFERAAELDDRLDDIALRFGNVFKTLAVFGGEAVVGLGMLFNDLSYFLGLGADSSTRMQLATDNLTLAIGDNITAAMALTNEIPRGIAVSKEWAQAQLNQSLATLAATDAQRQQVAEIAKSGAAYLENQGHINDIVQWLQNYNYEVAQAQDQGFPLPDSTEVDELVREMFRLQDAQQAILDAAAPLTPQYEAAKAEIAQIQDAINRATGETVTLVRETASVVELGDRLNVTLGGLSIGRDVFGQIALLAHDLGVTLELAQDLNNTLNANAGIAAAAPAGPQLGFSGIGPAEFGDVGNAVLGFGNLSASGTPTRRNVVDLTAPGGAGELSGAGGGSPGGAGGSPAEPAYWDALVDSVQAAQDEFEAFNEQADAGADRMSDLFLSIVDGSKSAKEALADVAREMAGMLAQQGFRGLAGLGGQSSSIFAGIGGIFGGFRASGGPVETGKSYVVGERGPELFTPARAGSITPNGAGGRSASMTFHIDARGAVEGTAQQIEAAFRRLGPGLVGQAVRQTGMAMGSSKAFGAPR